MDRCNTRLRLSLPATTFRGGERYAPRMAGARSVIVLELNELSPRIMDRFIAEGRLPGFARLRAESTVMITDPEEDQAHLNPWIQWVTVHTGVPRSEHRIEKLGESCRLEQATIARALRDAGKAAWICGSMNVPDDGSPLGAYLPDPWNPDSAPRPSELSAYSDFVRANVQEHTNASTHLSPALAARFLWFMARHGLSLRTLRQAVAQLVSERRSRRGSFARACVLDRLQWDVFRSVYLAQRPAFATFFSNSTAHFQHMYWRNFEPDQFTVQPTGEEQQRYGDAVALGYERMDGLVTDALALADEVGATLMLCTGLSQQPYLLAEDAGGKYTYRPKTFDAVLRSVGVPPSGTVAPVMAGEFHILFDSSRDAVAAAERFGLTTLDGEPVFNVRVVGGDVFTGCRITRDLPNDAQLIDADGRSHRFHDLFYRFETAKSGYHHPDGMWWVRTGEHTVIRDPVSLRSIAPTVLAMLDVPAAPTMGADPVALLSAGA